MKRLLIIATSAFFLCANAAQAGFFAEPQYQNKDVLTIVFGTDVTYVPFESTNSNGEIIGFDIDLGKGICAEIHARCTFVSQEFDGIIAGLNAKKYDAILSSLSITPERARHVDFTQAIWDAPNALVSLKTQPLKANNSALKGKKLAVQMGTVQESFAKKHFPSAKVKSYKTIEGMYNALRTGHADAAFMDQVTPSFVPPGDKRFQITDSVLSSADRETLGQGTAIAVRKNDHLLLRELNRGFDAIRANGTYQKIAQEYFTFNIYNHESPLSQHF